MQPCSAVITVVVVRVRSLLRQEPGQTLIEYGLILMLLAMAIVATLSLVGHDVTALFTTAESEFRNASTP